MLPEQQQRIMGYFIEEAKDHLNTIEQGLLNLQATIEDPEMANEVFRAAHSVKGGAAMLGLESIQRTSHRMEDYFKILKEARIQADRTLESMFLQVFDALQEQLEQLQGPFGLTDDKAEEIMAGVEPVFDQLEGHLNQLVATAGGDQPQPTPSPAPAVSRRNSEDSALQLVFNSDVSSYLRDMLGLFKQADTGQSRQSLQDICQQLTGFGEQFELSDWVNLTRTAKLAISHPENSYGTLAPIIIREIKQAKDLVLAGRISEVQVSNSLQSLIPVEVAPADLELEALALDDVGTGEELSGEDDLFGDGADLAPDNLAPDNLAPDELLLDTLDLDGDANTSADEGFDDLFTDTAGADLDSLAAADSPADTLPDLGLDALEALPELASNADTGNLEGGLDGLMGIGADPTGPEVGAAELNSLADLFEGDLGDLDDTWQEEDAALETPTGDVPDIDISSDFADLLETADSDNSDTLDSGDELADLFGDVLEESDLPDVPSTDMPPPNAPEDISADIGLDLADGLSELGLDSELDSGADDSLDLDLLGAFDEESSPAPVSSPEPFPEPFSAELAPEPDVLDLNDGLLDLDLADIPDVSPGEDDDALDSDLGAVFDVSDGLGGDDTAPLADLDLGDALALDDVSQSAADAPALDLEP
ncbi:MAG: Hpt domain-containing protein, partial [Cyanobacteria bacterium P01_A01_bin.105]